MFDAAPAAHQGLDAALAEVRSNLGAEHAMLIAGADVRCDGQFESRSPIDTELVLGRFQEGTPDDVDRAVLAARAAWPQWAQTPWPRRVDLLLRAATLLEASAYHLAAVSVLEVGKSRLEALCEVHETVDLIRAYCRETQDHHGFVRDLPKDPIDGFVSRNRALLKPYGVWGVIAPFNFPFALAGGPAAAALLAGNCVVHKASRATPWSGWLLAQCLREAGIPPGVFNYLTGTAARVGDPLVRHPELCGITFNGSYENGIGITRAFANHRYPRPCIAAMGGKNPVIVSRNADLARAALGIVRSAFSLQGQNGAACSRVLVDRVVADQLVDRILANVRELKVGDPCLRATTMGPVINRAAYERYLRLSAELAAEGQVLCGGGTLNDGALVRGYYCEPAVAQLRPGHPLWREELFLPILLVTSVGTLEEAMELANGVDYGLSAGFYGAKEEIAWFLDNIEAGVAYCNRPQGATTGAWPCLQPLGGWKASGSTGKASGSWYYLQQYMREQSQTVVD
ncbi:MAG: aldehyde dehydrogenase family protein [Betaproteobacteria bacterium]|nr:MAG: aldehyde dehydrogenase family protein [Betaproteobacteria bacterium]